MRSGVVCVSHLQDSILDFLRTAPANQTKRDIADGIGVNVATLHRALIGLKKFGLVVTRKDGCKVYWEAC